MKQIVELAVMSSGGVDTGLRQRLASRRVAWPGY